MKTKRTKRKNKYTELRAAIAAVRSLEGGFHAQHVVLVGLTPEAQEQFAAAMRRLLVGGWLLVGWCGKGVINLI